MRTLLAGLGLVALGVFSAPPSLRISAPATSVAQWDTMANVTATPRTLDGKVAASSPVTWASSPSGRVAITTMDKFAHVVAIAGVMPGPVSIIASWRTFSGAVRVVNGLPTIDTVTLRDSMRLTVTDPTVTIAPFNGVEQGSPFFDPALAVFCLYAHATDKHGGEHPGLPATWSSNDTTLMRALNRPPCSDTTVNPRLLPSSLPRPQ